MKLDIGFFIYFCEKDDNTYKLYIKQKISTVFLCLTFLITN